MAKNPYRKGTNKYTYFQELQKLKRRAKSWEKKYKISYTDFPTMPERVTKSSIERLRSIRYKNLSEVEKKQAKREYEYRYENKLLPDQYLPSQSYTPPTETNFYYDNEPFVFDEPEPIDNQPVNSYEEIDSWLETLFDEILSYDDNDSNHDVRSILEGLLNDAKTRMGAKALYEYFETGDIVSQLHMFASNALSGSPRNGNLSSDQMHQIGQFAQVLNMGRPLSQEQSMTLETEWYVDFDYSEYD